MIVFRKSDLDLIKAEARKAFPNECCGLLAGRRDADKAIVTQVAVSPNLAEGDQTDRFEVDPQVRFDLMRVVAETGEQIIGHYHSHPNHPARPSATDLSMAYEPDLIWVIVGLDDRAVADVTAHRLDGRHQAFEEIPLLVSEQPA